MLFLWDSPPKSHLFSLLKSIPNFNSIIAYLPLILNLGGPTFYGHQTKASYKKNCILSRLADNLHFIICILKVFFFLNIYLF